MHHNWLKTGWVDCHCTPTGTINDLGNNLASSDPMFINFGNQAFQPDSISPLINNGDIIPDSLLPAHDVIHTYSKHTGHAIRPKSGNLDIGAYEYFSSTCSDTTVFMSGSWNNGPPDISKYVIIKSDYQSNVHGNIHSCTCSVEPNALLVISSGDSLQVEYEMTVLGMVDLQQGSVVDVQSQ
jgi:hypothetical protein